MNPNPVKIEWLKANQALLVAEFARLKLQLEGQEAAMAVVAATEARVAMEVPAAIDRVTELFELTEFEREVLLLCAGVEMDARLAALQHDGRPAAPEAVAHDSDSALPAQEREDDLPAS